MHADVQAEDGDDGVNVPLVLLVPGGVRVGACDEIGNICTTARMIPAKINEKILPADRVEKYLNKWPCKDPKYC